MSKQCVNNRSCLWIAKQKEKKVQMSNLYISKKQLSILTLGLMSLTREEKAFNYGIENGIFTEDDIYDYVETLRSFAGKIDQEDGAILSTEINFDDVDHKDCVDLSGMSLDGGI
jgi:hypothetical protein